MMKKCVCSGYPPRKVWLSLGSLRSLSASRSLFSNTLYETCISVGEKKGPIEFIHESRVSFLPDPWESDADVLRLTLIHDRFPVKGASVVVVHYDGENCFERFLHADQNGKIYFSTAKKGVYMAVTRKPLAEGIEGVYDSKEIASTFTYVKR